MVWLNYFAKATTSPPTFNRKPAVWQPSHPFLHYCPKNLHLYTSETQSARSNQSVSETELNVWSLDLAHGLFTSAYDHVCTFDKVTGILAVNSVISSLLDQPEIRTSFMFVSFFSNRFYRFLYHCNQMISRWRIWPSTSKSTCVVPAWRRTMLLFGSVQADDRSNWHLAPRDVHLFKMNCKLWLACVYLSESRFGAILKGVCVCHWRPAGLHAHVPLVKDSSSQQVKNENSLQQEDESVVELDFVQKTNKHKT